MRRFRGEGRQDKEVQISWRRGIWRFREVAGSDVVVKGSWREEY